MTVTAAGKKIPAGATRGSCPPPIRDAANRERLWAGLKEGIIDFIVSDHSPCTPELKRLDEGDFMAAWGGISSVQLSVALVWTEAKQRGFGLSDLHRWMCQGPARFAGLNPMKGLIATGFDADLVVWDPEKRKTIMADKQQSAIDYNVFEGHEVVGLPRFTLKRGQVAVREGEVPTRGGPGRFVAREARRAGRRRPSAGG